MKHLHSPFALAACAAVFAWAPLASADKVAVLPFTGGLDQAQTWTQEASVAKGHTLPTPSEILSAQMAVTDGVADTSSEYRAAGRASGSQWTLAGHVERSDGGYRIEIVACQVASGRVESLAREVDPDNAPAQIAEMLALLLRPEGLANAEIPWASGTPGPKAKPAPKPAAEPAPAAPAEPARPAVKHAYAEGHPLALGASIGVSGALVQPANARGPSLAMPVGAAVAYAIDAVPGFEVRGVFTSQVVGPRALEIAAGARYAFPLLAEYRIFVGPELLAGAHVAIGAEKTARFLGHGAAFAAIGIGERLQVELAFDLAAALGGSGPLILGGTTARALARF